LLELGTEIVFGICGCDDCTLLVDVRFSFGEQRLEFRQFQRLGPGRIIDDSLVIRPAEVAGLPEILQRDIRVTDQRTRQRESLEIRRIARQCHL
jgi:hypothetical protein